MNKIKRFTTSYIALMLAVVLVGSIFSSSTVFAASKSKSSGSDYTEGDKVYIGEIDGEALYWTVLKYDSATGVALLITKDPLNTPTIRAHREALEAAAPDGKARGYVNWANNNWRNWLNNEFYNTVFNEEQRSKIQKTSNTKSMAQDSIMNFFHDTTLDADYIRNGVKNSMDLDIYNKQVSSSDKLFFLSSDEYTEFKDLINIGSGWAVWALRTNSYDKKNSTLCVDETNGNLIDSFYTYDNNSIRPAMYIKLKDLETESTDTENAETVSKDDASKDTNKKDTSSKNDSSTTNKTNTSSGNKGASASAVIRRRSYANNATDISSSTTSKISLPDDASYTIKKGDKAQVTMDLSYLNGSNKKYTVTYSTSDTSVFTVDSSGVITAGTDSGVATLSVRMKKSNGKIYNMSCRINVK